MYAVIKTGGKQYKVTQGDILNIEKLAANEGESIDFNDVLLVANGGQIKVGTPLVSGGKVTATVQEQGRSKKIQIIKFKRRKHHLKRMGHRQYYTQAKITEIMADGIEPSPQSTETEVQNVEATTLETVTETTPQSNMVETQTTETTVRATSTQPTETTVSNSTTETQTTGTTASSNVTEDKTG